MIRDLKIDDANNMLCWMHDLSINKLFDKDFFKYDIDKCKSFIKECIVAYANKTPKDLHFAIISDDSDEYKGTVSLKNINYDTMSAEFAIVVIKSAQGRGLAKQAFDDIIRFAFDKLNLGLVYFSCKKDNIVANKFYSKTIAKSISFDSLLKKIGGEVKGYTNDIASNLLWYEVIKQ